MHLMERYGADEKRFAEAARFPEFCLARVIAQYNDLYKIICETGEALASVSGKLRHETPAPSLFPAVGDFVLTDGASGGGNAVLHRVLERRSAFLRASVGADRQSQMIATNIDTVFLCMSLNQNYSLNRLERYLSVAWSSGAAPVVVLTKADLCDSLPAALAEIEGIAPGVDVLAVSSREAATCGQLLPYLRPGKTVSLIGSSGVGKSTLINTLAGEELLSTREIRMSDDKGRHTTTRRELFVLPGGGLVIDTPGMRELGADAVDLSRSFADIDALVAKCRFSDCSHQNEPGCAVRQAIESGELDERRLESYQKLKREAKYDGLSARALEHEKLSSMFGDVGGMKKMRKFIRETDKRKRG